MLGSFIEWPAMFLSAELGANRNMSGKLGMKLAILGECLLISSLPGKAMRTLVDITRLAERFNMHIKRREPGIQVISLSIVLERSGKVLDS